MYKMSPPNSEPTYPGYAVECGIGRLSGTPITQTDPILASCGGRAPYEIGCKNIYVTDAFSAEPVTLCAS